MSNNHFKDSMPIIIQAKMQALAKYVQENFTNLLMNQGEQTGEVMINEIHGKHYDSWIPFQDGGYSVDCFYRCDEDTSYHFTDKQSEFMDKLASDCRKDFASEYNIPEDFDYDSLADEQKEALQEFEASSLDDPALVKFVMYIQDDKVKMRFELNYRDAPYYRDSKSDIIESHEISFESFMKHDLQTLAVLFATEWRSK